MNEQGRIMQQVNQSTTRSAYTNFLCVRNLPAPADCWQMYRKAICLITRGGHKSALTPNSRNMKRGQSTKYVRVYINRRGMRSSMFGMICTIRTVNSVNGTFTTVLLL